MANRVRLSARRSRSPWVSRSPSPSAVSHWNAHRTRWRYGVAHSASVACFGDRPATARSRRAIQPRQRTPSPGSRSSVHAPTSIPDASWSSATRSVDHSRCSRARARLVPAGGR